MADLLPREQLGTGFGWFHLVSGLSLLPASLLFGSLWEAWSPLAAFGCSAALALLALVLLRRWVGLPAQDGR